MTRSALTWAVAIAFGDDVALLVEQGWRLAAAREFVRKYPCFGSSCPSYGCLTRGCYLARANDVVTKMLEDSRKCADPPP